MKKAAPKPRTQHRKTYIREWRKHRGKTIEWLAEQVGLEPSAISYLERGLSGYTQGSIEKIAEALGTTPAVLIRRPPRNEAIEVIETASESELRELAGVLTALRETRK